MLANILKSIGMTLRTVVLLAVFLTVFVLAGLILPITSNNEINWPWFFCLIPLFFVDIILIIAVCSSSTRAKLAQKRIENSNQTEPSPGKLSIGFACHATYVAVGILLICFLLLFGFQEYLPEIFGTYVFVGWIAIYKIMWPFYRKRMK